jgi:DNA repair exonuclease SbcCD nuclease subunit
MSILICGDLHVDKHEDKIPNFTKLVLKCLSNTVRKATDNGIDTIVLAGDIFDSPEPSQAAIVSVMRCLQRMEATVYILLGNHDSSNAKKHSLQVAQWFSSTSESNSVFVVTKPKIIESDDYKMLLLPHPYVYDLPTKCDIGVAHFAVNGAKSDNGFAVRSNHAPKGDWILGDFHTAQRGISKGCKYEYVGSLTQLAWEESEKKSVISLNDGDRNRIRVEPTYRLKKVTVASEGDLVNLKATTDIPTYFNVVLTENYRLPNGFLLENPHILKATPQSVRKDKRAQVLLEDSESTIDPLRNLEAYLLKQNVNEQVAVRALKYAKRLQKQYHALR